MSRPRVEEKRKRFQATLSSSELEKLKVIRSSLNFKYLEYLPDTSIMSFLINLVYEKLEDIKGLKN